MDIIALKFKQQKMIDHCGSSATALTGELGRSYNARTWTEFKEDKHITVLKSILERASRNLHRVKSKSEFKERQQINDKFEIFRYDKCQKGFKKRDEKSKRLSSTHKKMWKINI